MPPEVVAGGKIDQRADIYSLAAVAFELLTGRILFQHDNVVEVLHRIAHVEAPPPSRCPGAEWVPPELDALVVQMLAKDPEVRPATMADVRASLRRLRAVTERAWANAFLREGREDSRLLRKRSASPNSPRTTQQVVNPRALPVLLAVDDDAVIRSIIERLARGAGWECETVESAEAAQAWMQLHPPPDVVLIDVLMPGMDGLSLAAALRQDGFTGPMVFCTGVATPEIRGEMATVGASWCLDKVTEIHRVPQLLRLAELGRAEGQVTG